MVADTCSAPHINCPNLTKHSVLLTNLVLGLLDRQGLRNLILQATFLIGVAPYWVVSANLIVGRIVKGRHEESEQPKCPTSWD